MSNEDENHVKNVLKFFYPQQIPPGSISDEVGNLAAEMLSEALKGSKAMDFVPRPPGLIPGVGWLISQPVQMAWRRIGNQKIYDIVRKTVDLKFRNRYEMAKCGI